MYKKAAITTETMSVLTCLLCLAISSASASSEALAQNVALLRPAEQSTTFASREAALAVDGNVETCSSTEAAREDHQRWWSVTLPTSVNVQEVSIHTNHGAAHEQNFTIFVIAKTGDQRTKFHKCESFSGLFKAGQKATVRCPDGGITGEKVYIRDDRRAGTLSLCEVEVVAASSGICAEPPAIANGRTTVLTQQHLKYECHEGYLLWGPTDLHCRPNNTWSFSPPVCSPITCGYPHVEDINAIVVESKYSIEKGHGAKDGDEATIACSAGYQMVSNSTSSDDKLKAVDSVRVVCDKDGVWQKPFQYSCIDKAQMTKVLLAPEVTTDSTSRSMSLSTQSIVYTLLAIIFFLLLLLFLTFLLRRKRAKDDQRKLETAVTAPRTISVPKSSTSTKPLISIFTTLDSHKSSTASTTNLLHSKGGGSNARLISSEDSSLGNEPTAAAAMRSSKKLSYEEELRLPESGSIVLGVPVDPHSAVFGKNGVRLEELERQFQNGLPDVTTSSNFYSQNRPYLSSFQSPSRAAITTTSTSSSSSSPQHANAQSVWLNGNAWGSIPPPPPVVRPSGNGDFWKMALVEHMTRNVSSLPANAHAANRDRSRLFSVRSLNESVIMAPPQFSTAELPALDEAGYASLIVQKKAPKVEPVYERIRGEHPSSQEALENESDRESQAYYSRVAKDEAQSLSSEQPPPLKEHLYQNFDQVFLAMEHRHPDLLLLHDTDQFYENLRRPVSSSTDKESKTVVVNDEKLRNMYAQVDVAKKHFERSTKNSPPPLQVEAISDQPRPAPVPFVDLKEVQTAWEEHI